MNAIRLLLSISAAAVTYAGVNAASDPQVMAFGDVQIYSDLFWAAIVAIIPTVLPESFISKIITSIAKERLGKVDPNLIKKIAENVKDDLYPLLKQLYTVISESDNVSSEKLELIKKLAELEAKDQFGGK